VGRNPFPTPELGNGASPRYGFFGEVAQTRGHLNFSIFSYTLPPPVAAEDSEGITTYDETIVGGKLESFMKRSNRFVMVCGNRSLLSDRLSAQCDWWSKL